MRFVEFTDAMVAVEGEPCAASPGSTSKELESGEWAVGGNPLTAADAKAIGRLCDLSLRVLRLSHLRGIALLSSIVP